MRDSYPRFAQATGRAFEREQGDMNVEMKVKELTDSDRKVQESLDNFIRLAIGRELFLPFPGANDSPTPWINWLDTLDQQGSKISKGLNVEVTSDAKDSRKEEGAGINSPVEKFSRKDSKPNGEKSGSIFGRGLQNTAERGHGLKIPEAVAALAQAAAKDLSGWPLMSPVKAPLQKCGKCSREFYSPLNYRRHIRMHRRPFIGDKDDLRKERPHVAAFWDKLSLEKSIDILNYEKLMMEGLLGTSVVRALPNFIQQASLTSPPQSYLNAGIRLLEIVQHKLARLELSSEELFGIIDDATEKTFLFGSASVSVQRFLFEGDGEKIGLEPKNLIASLALLVEQILVSSWIADKDAKALECLQALVEEEEAAQKKREKTLEKKRLKKLRQKEHKDKDRKVLDSLPDLHLPDLHLVDRSDLKNNAEGLEFPAVTVSSPSSSASSMHDLANLDPSNDDIEKFKGSANNNAVNTLSTLADEGSLHVADDDEDDEGGHCRSPDVIENFESNQNGSLMAVRGHANSSSYDDIRMTSSWRGQKPSEWSEYSGNPRQILSNERRFNGSRVHPGSRKLYMNGSSLNEYSDLCAIKSSLATNVIQYNHKSLGLRSVPATHAVWTRKVQKTSLNPSVATANTESQGDAVPNVKGELRVEGSENRCVTELQISSTHNPESLSLRGSDLTGSANSNYHSAKKSDSECCMTIDTLCVGSLSVPLDVVDDRHRGFDPMIEDTDWHASNRVALDTELIGDCRTTPFSKIAARFLSQRWNDAVEGILNK